jgi:Protein of unknown function (DUF2001).
MESGGFVSGSQGECYITIDGRRYNFMSLKSFSAKAEKQKEKFAVLGKTGKINKTTGWEGTGNIGYYLNSSIFAVMMQKLKDTGKDVYFEIQVTNEDAGSDVGKQTIVFKNCNADAVDLAKLEPDTSALEGETSFTFDDFLIVDQFTELVGM